MPNEKQTKKWYFVVWEMRHPRKPFAHVQNSITDEHPVEFLLEAHKGSHHRVSMLFYTELDVSSSQAAAWRKKLDEYYGS